MKKLILILILSILIGVLLGIYSYHTFNDEEILSVNKVNETVYAIQIGVFDSVDNASKLANKYNAIVINDNNKYRVYIAICSDTLNILKNYYNQKNIAYYVKTIDVSNNFYNTLKDYELLLSESNSETYDVIIKKILIEYEDDLL